jgi:hypothetical protein
MRQGRSGPGSPDRIRTSFPDQLFAVTNPRADAYNRCINVFYNRIAAPGEDDLVSPKLDLRHDRDAGDPRRVVRRHRKPAGDVGDIEIDQLRGDRRTLLAHSRLPLGWHEQRAVLGFA